MIFCRLFSSLTPAEYSVYTYVSYVGKHWNTSGPVDTIQNTYTQMRLSIWLFGLVLFSPCINCGMCICYIYVWLFSISFKSRKIETEWHDTTAHTYGRAHKPCGTQKIVLRLSHLMCYKHRPKYVYICIYAIFIAKYWNVNITKKKKNKKVENHGTDQAEWGYIITTSQIQVCKALLCVCGMCSFRIWISICNVILYFFLAMMMILP